MSVQNKISFLIIQQYNSFRVFSSNTKSNGKKFYRYYFYIYYHPDFYFYELEKRLFVAIAKENEINTSHRSDQNGLKPPF